ncbi:MAG: aspartate kinase [Chlamydiia bacterium]|nr:aspartate kinase [Chlamydiia bacterium]
MKFGGASVATPECFSQIAALIAVRLQEHKQVAVVVSAMADTTDRLLDLAHQIHPNPPKRELDMLVSVGERISIALLAMALSLQGIEAISFTGSQSGIITCENHADAKIVAVRPHRLLPVLEKGQVVIVAGFQGVSRKGEITTLGRGGSDTTAVALAVALGASLVEFYKDVSGIFTADPKKDPSAQLLSELSFADALDLIVQTGAKILHPRSIALAAKNGIALSIYSFLHPQEGGTKIGWGEKKRNESMLFEHEVI